MKLKKDVKGKRLGRDKRRPVLPAHVVGQRLPHCALGFVARGSTHYAACTVYTLTHTTQDETQVTNC